MSFAEHGGDVPSLQKPICDLSVSLNPFGTPPAVRIAASRAAYDCSEYPDNHCTALRRSLALAERVPEECIVCGNGAAELIYRLFPALHIRHALVPVPTFDEYEEATRQYGAELTRHPMREENGFRLEENFEDAIHRPIDAVFVCNPNNPTGHALPSSLQRRWVEKALSEGIWWIVDESFMDLTVTPGRFTIKQLLPEYPNLIVVKSMTKTFAVPGLRIGYGLCGDPHAAHRLEEAAPPWSVSSPAQAAAEAACMLPSYISESAVGISALRRRLRSGLESLGLKVLPSSANFLLFRCEIPNLVAKLAKRGIWIRDSEGFCGLEESWYRTAVPQIEKQDLLIRALDAVLESHRG